MLLLLLLLLLSLPVSCRCRRHTVTVYAVTVTPLWQVLYLLLMSTSNPDNNVKLLRQGDIMGWSAFHYAARSGLLGYVDWKWLLQFQLRSVPVKLTNLTGATMLHLVRDMCLGCCSSVDSLLVA